MTDLVFITGNMHKVEQLTVWLGLEVGHQKVNLDELQSIDLQEIVAHKARQAFGAVHRPVIVEDCSLTFTALDPLPGPFIKWFEMPGLEWLCRSLDACRDRSATARTMYGLYDGTDLHVFEGIMKGVIAEHPRGTGGFGFDPVFINEGQTLTRGELDEDIYARTSYRRPALTALKAYVQST